MNRKLAKDIVATFGPEQIEVLTLFVDDEIERLRIALENSNEVDHMRKLQGSIASFNKIKRIRNDALHFLEMERNG